MVSLFSSKTVRTTCGLGLLGAIAFLGVGLGGCTTTEDVGETLQTVDGFCQQLGVAECSPALVDACYQLAPTQGETSELQQSTQRCASAAAEIDTCNPQNLPYHAENAQTAIDTIQEIFRAPQQIDATQLGRINDALATVFYKGGSNGSVCEVDTDCDSGAGSKCIVHAGKGICGVPVATQPGESCAKAGAECVSPVGNTQRFICNGSLTCGVASNTGAACIDSSDCMSNLCKDKVCSGLKANGVSCSLASECENGFCLKASGGDQKTGRCGSLEDFDITSASCDPYH